ncbi:hypothetical protein HG717_09160 [Rhodococcus erythropolis]|uniref:hypothetical protein n=1 Tax=Rhodococcus erythropolis TaxID=1833 RepID=UPI001C9B04AC|nr:hypothetical protein [Rhodococcus erythropolis]MBY6384069.1 hypothetical protein [Rhodococcus erythropolis]
MTNHTPVDPHAWRTSPDSVEDVLLSFVAASVEAAHIAHMSETYAEVYRVIANHPRSTHNSVIAMTNREHSHWTAEEIRSAITHMHGIGVVRIEGLFRKRLTATYWPVVR